ncbi:MAG: translocation/assembly module TamB [Gammaproteobacteria bacterium]|nr:translocation/assembly module TamB [Gammaproteobacteria bacterium]
MIKAILRSLILFFIFIAAIITFLLTPTGLRVSMYIVPHLLPGKLTVKKVSGVLIGPLTIEDLHYQNKEENINIKKLRFNWYPSALLKKQLHIGTLEISGLHIITKNNSFPEKWDPDKTQKTINAFIAFFQENTQSLRLIINKADIVDTDITDPASKAHIQIQEFYFHARFTDEKWDGNIITIIKNPNPYELNFQLQGKPNNYTANLTLVGDHTDLKISGVGNQEALSIVTPKQLLLNGSLNAQLQFLWGKKIKWKGAFITKNINLSLINKQWINFLSVDINSAGDDNNHLTTENDARVEIPNGSLHLTLSHKNKWNIHWHAKMHSLANWLSQKNGIHANIESLGTIQGDFTNPDFDIELKGQLHNPEKITAAKINLTGNFKKHTLQAIVDSKNGKIHLKIDGHYAENIQQWNGNLEQFTITLNHNFTWQLAKKTVLLASKKEATIEPFCLHSIQAGNICLQSRWFENKIKAIASINITHFDWLRAWTHRMTVPTGQFHASILVNGPIDQPVVTGKLNLGHGSIAFPRLNITLNTVTAGIISNGKIINIKAQAYSAKNPINLEGSIDLSQPALAAQFSLNSNQALIFNTEEFVATASPNLKAIIKGNNIFISGDILIPSGSIHPNDFQTTTTLQAQDIVYVGQAAVKPLWEINTNINFTLGKNVNVDVSGIKAKLSGTVHLSQDANEDLFATGTVFIRDGIYNLYGQTLTIAPNSYLDYENSLLDNPGLSVKASKIISSVTNMGISNFTQNNLIVGVALQGTAKDPKISFYSNRSRLSQADILSYILLGYGNDSNTPGNTDFLLRALSAVKITSQSLLGKQNIASQIQSGLGLNQLGVESETTTDALGNPLSRESSIVVGKSLTRRFYMRVSYGLLSQVYVYQFGYLLNHKWSLQTDSSILGVGADVMYTFAKK